METRSGYATICGLAPRFLRSVNADTAELTKGFPPAIDQPNLHRPSDRRSHVEG